MTRAPIYFGGAPGARDPDEPVWPPEEEVLRSDEGFLHYVSTVWVHEHAPPTELPALAEFDVHSLVPLFHEFLAAGKRSPRRGMTIEEHWLMGQIVSRQPLTCLQNARQPTQPLGRISRVRRVSPDELVAELTAFYGDPDLAWAYPDAAIPNAPVLTLTYDGKVGHAIVVWTVHEDTVHFQDPWPTRSLLCAGKNAAGVAAEESDLVAHAWRLTLGELGRVVYQVLLPNPPVPVPADLRLTAQERESAELQEKVMDVLRAAQSPASGRPAAPIAGMRTVSRLVFASKFGRMGEVKAALQQGDDVNATGELGPPLHNAAENGHLAIVELLVAHGADVAATDAKGRTALELAEREGHAEVAAYLRSCL
jgi:hypothetical protein